MYNHRQKAANGMHWGQRAKQLNSLQKWMNSHLNLLQHEDSRVLLDGLTGQLGGLCLNLCPDHGILLVLLCLVHLHALQQHRSPATLCHVRANCRSRLYRTSVQHT